MCKRSLGFGIVLLFVGSGVGWADPVVIYSHFGPGTTWGPSAVPIMGPGAPTSEGEVTPGQMAAAGFFVPAGQYQLSSFDVPFGVPHGTPSPVNITLQVVPDAGGRPGTMVLDTASVLTSGSLESIASTTRPVLSAGFYWLVASTLDPRASPVWFFGPVASHTRGAIRLVGGEWGSTGGLGGALRVFAEPVQAPVPEPGTLLLVGGGIAAGIRSARRRRISASC